MKTKPFAVGAVALGLSTLKSVSRKTCAATAAVCNKAWLSNTAKTNACRGRVTLTKIHSRNQFLMGNYFYQGTVNATTQIA